MQVNLLVLKEIKFGEQDWNWICILEETANGIYLAAASGSLPVPHSMALWFQRTELKALGQNICPTVLTRRDNADPCALNYRRCLTPAMTGPFGWTRNGWMGT